MNTEMQLLLFSKVKKEESMQIFTITVYFN